jgi:hypothetical protein
VRVVHSVRGTVIHNFAAWTHATPPVEHAVHVPFDLVQLSLSKTIEHQLGVVARPQVVLAGIDDHTIYRRCRRGDWQRVLPGIYLTAAGTLSLDQRRIAAALFAGEEAQLTGAATLFWYGFKSPLATDRIHVVVPHHTRRRSSGFVVVQRTLSLDDAARDLGLFRITSPARAVVDACRLMSDLQGVRAVMAEAVQASFVDVKSLDDEIRRAVRSRTALARRALTEILDGIQSSPEAELRAITIRSRILPPIAWNPRLTGPDGEVLPTPDGLLAEVKIALEVDSREHHASGDGWRRTLQRHNVLTQHGFIVLHFTPAEIRSEANRVLRVIEQTYRRRVHQLAIAQ